MTAMQEVARPHRAAASSGSAAWLVPAAALAYGALLYVTLPPTPIVVNDDFGYLRSIVETLAHGRPWTDDWLEPWSASLSVLAILLFKLTGSFHFATSGAQALFGAASVAGAAALLRRRGLGTSSSAALAVIVVSIPTLLWKSLEYGGVALYLPCLFWAIWAAEDRRWGLFFLAWTLAIASRQSALVWLALPGWAFLTAWINTREEKRSWIAPGLTCVGGLVVFGVLSGLMNKTHSQAAITDHIWKRLDADTSLMFGGVGVATALTFLGLGAVAVGLRKPGASPTVGRVRRIVFVIAAVATLAVVLRRSTDVFVEHESYSGTWGRAYAALAIVLAVVGWWWCRFTVRWGLLLAATGSLALVLLRRQVWDYYFLDVALLAFFSPIVSVARPDESSRRSASVWWGICLLVGAFHVSCAIDLKLFLDRFYALSILAEDALGSGRIDAADLSFAAHGLIAWHLHPYFVANEGKASSNIGGFMGYVRPDSVLCGFGNRFRGEEPAESRSLASRDGPLLLGTGVFRVLWFWRQRAVLIRNPGPGLAAARMPIDRSRYELDPFPLNDEQWRIKLEDAGRRSSKR